MILCAAIKFYIDRTNREVIIPCWRHGEAYKIMRNLGFSAKDGYKEVEQGFITNEGVFLDRKLAYNHAIGCGQISQTTRWYKEDHEEITELYSEDLY